MHWQGVGNFLQLSIYAFEKKIIQTAHTFFMITECKCITIQIKLILAPVFRILYIQTLDNVW